MLRNILLNRKKCSKCPYTLGWVKTPRNPCPECKASGYRMFEEFSRRAHYPPASAPAEANEGGGEK
jgi:hypothetical protein